MNIEELKAQIKAVHEARLQANSSRLALEEERQAWEAEHAALFDDANQAAIELRAAEEELRHLTLEAYEETGNKAPAPGVGIREVSVLDYRESIAFEWAVSHGLALQLNKKAFEKIAGATSLDFVIIFKEPQATIATDLTEAIAELEKER